MRTRFPYLVRSVALLSVAAFTSFTPLHAQDFEAGIEAYHESEYADAITAFETALESGESAALRHNLALSYYQTGAPAEAAWQLERAVRLAPLNESYLFKLGALRQQLGLYEAPVEWWQSASRVLSQSTWIWIACVSFWCLLAAILLPRFGGSTRPIGLKLLIGLSLVAMTLSVLALGVLSTQKTSGIIASEQAATLHHAPASAAPEIGIARPGERAEVIDQHGDYLKVKTESGITGWMPKEAFRKL